MAIYWKTKRLNNLSVAYKLKELIPELKGVYSEHIESYLRGSGLEFYETEKAKAPLLIRLTLPFAFIVFVAMLALLPISYIITGKWSYDVIWVKNWFKMLGL